MNSGGKIREDPLWVMTLGKELAWEAVKLIF